MNGSITVGHPVDVASGTVYFQRLDISVRGRLPINWVRKYSTVALDRTGLHGPGWSTLYSAQLYFEGDSLVFQHMDGAAGLFPNALARLPNGQIVRDLSASAEIAVVGKRYVVSIWDCDTLKVEQYSFGHVTEQNKFVLLGMQDANGVSLDLFYDARSRLVTIRQRLEGRTVGLSYTADQRLETLSVLDGETWRPVTHYTYDSLGRLVAVENAANNTEQYEYDSAGRIISEKTKTGAVFSFVYDYRGRCVYTAGPNGYDAKKLSFKDNLGWTEVTDSLGHVSRFRWNERGQITHAINACGEVTVTEYDEHGRIKARLFPGNRPISYEYDECGNQKTIIDALGRTIKFSFNDRHQVTNLVDPGGNTWTSAYDSEGRWISHTTPLGSVWKFDYDNQGNLIGTTDPRGLRSRIVYLSASTWEFHDYAGHKTTFDENYLGRIIRRVEPSLKITNYIRDAIGRVVRITTSEGTDLQYQYDVNGNLTSIRDSLGATTKFRFGTCRRIIERIDAAGGKRKFRWGNEPNRLDEIIDENGERYRFEYDPAGRVIREIFPRGGVRYEYDSRGFRSALEDEAGNRTEYVRDAVGQLIGIQTPDGEEISYEYDLLGGVVRASNDAAELSFVRDAHGRVVREIQDAVTIDFAFDAAGCITKIKSTAGPEIRFEYDANAMPVFASLNGTEVWSAVRDVNRNEIERRLPGDLYLQQTFDLNRSLLRQHLRSTAGGSLLQRTFSYDVAGRLIALKDSIWGETGYAYDTRDRIWEQDSPQCRENFTYDPASNVKSIGGSLTETLEYDAGNRLVQAGSTRMEYDPQGRFVLRHDSVTESANNLVLDWNSIGRLLSAKSPDGKWTYSYDAIGRRLQKNSAEESVRFVWVGDVLLQELFSSGRSRTWITPPGTFSPVAMADGQQTFGVITDATGTARDLVSSSGKLQCSISYGTWGEVQKFFGDITQLPIRFPGQYFDHETGFHYSRFRYYDPHYGRFISPDPLGLNGGLNEYTYAPNPFGWIDPLGLIVVYRNLRPDENPQNGLSARQPGRDMSPAGHVMNGSRDNFKGSQYMSTTTDPAVAEQWRKEGQAQVRFDTDNVVPDSKGNLSIVDISDREKATQQGLKGRAVGYAAASKEVLVEGHVPPEALETVPPKEDEEKEKHC